MNGSINAQDHLFRRGTFVNDAILGTRMAPYADAPCWS